MAACGGMVNDVVGGRVEKRRTRKKASEEALILGTEKT